MNSIVEQDQNNLVSAARPRTNALGQSAGAQALVQRTLAEVQVAVMMAKQFPRDKIMARESLMNDCCREELAQVAMYQYSRGGTDITGPSIHLAQAAKKAWTNMQSGWRELSRIIGADGIGVSEIEAFCWDSETNTRESVVFSVRHWRDTKKGGYKLTDERDIYELCANQASRRERACILKTIDGDLIESAIKQCETTLATKVQVTPETIAAMVKAFAENFDVTQTQIEKRIQRRIDTMTAPQLINLRKIYTSLKDGMSRAVDWFEPEEVEETEETAKKANGNEAVKAKLKKDKAKDAGADPETGELKSAPEEKAAEKDNAEIPAALRKQAAAEKAAKPDAAPEKKEIINTAAIAVRAMEGDATRTDFEAWGNEFASRCEKAQTLDGVAELYKNNVKILNQIEKLKPEIYAKCETAYTLATDILGGTSIKEAVES